MRILALILLPFLLGATTAPFPPVNEAATLPLFGELPPSEGLFAREGAWQVAGALAGNSAARNSLVVIDGIVGGWVYAGFFATTLAAPLAPAIALAPPVAGDPLLATLFLPQPVTGTASPGSSSLGSSSLDPAASLNFAASLNSTASLDPAASDLPTLANPEPGSEFLVLLPLALLVAFKRLKRA